MCDQIVRVHACTRIGTGSASHPHATCATDCVCVHVMHKHNARTHRTVSAFEDVLYMYMYIYVCSQCMYMFCCYVHSMQIRAALLNLKGLQQPRDVRVIREHVTNTSRGFCFLEFTTAEVRRVEGDCVHVYVCT